MRDVPDLEPLRGYAVKMAHNARASVPIRNKSADRILMASDSANLFPFVAVPAPHGSYTLRASLTCWDVVVCIPVAQPTVPESRPGKAVIRSAVSFFRGSRFQHS
jgi:hypothetical protein